MQNYYYSINHECNSIENCYSIEIDLVDTSNGELEELANLCAEDYFEYHDGLEHANHPDNFLKIFVYDESSKLVCASETKFEFDPSFSSKLIKQAG